MKKKVIKFDKRFISVHLKKLHCKRRMKLAQKQNFHRKSIWRRKCKTMNFLSFLQKIAAKSTLHRFRKKMTFSLCHRMQAVNLLRQCYLLKA